MKRILSFIVLLFAVVLLVSCGDDLNPPKNLKVDNHVLSWDKVSKVDKYLVVVDSTDHEALSNEFNLKDLNLELGTYTIGVKSVKGKETSKLSATVTYKVEASLNVPANVLITGDNLAWESVIGADGYVISINGKEYNSLTTNLDLSNLELGYGTHLVKVKAKSATNESAYSSAVEYVLVYEVSDEVKIGLLNTFRTNYRLNMSENDFSTKEEYQRYLLRVDYIEKYIVAAAANGVSVSKLNSLFMELTKFETDEVNIDDFNDLVNYANLLEAEGLTGNLLGTILYLRSVLDLNENILHKENFDEATLANYLILIETLTEEKEIIIESISGIYNFLTVTIKAFNNENNIGLINKLVNGDDLTPAELILFKNVMLPIIKNSVPEQEKFEQLYTVLITLSADLAANDLSELLEQAKTMAEATTITIDLSIEFLELLSIEFFNGVQAIIDNEESPLEILVYVLEYYEEFINENMDAYDHLVSEEAKKAAYISLIDAVLESAEEFGEVSEAYLLMVNILKDNYELVNGVLSFDRNKVIPLIKSLSEMNKATKAIHDNELNLGLNGVIKAAHDIDALILGDLDKEYLEDLVSLAKLFVLAQVSEENLYEEELGHLIDIVIYLNDFKSLILAEAADLDVSPFMITDLEGQANQYKLIHYVATVLDNVLTEEVQGELLGLVDVLIDDILSNEELYIMTGLAEMGTLEENRYSFKMMISGFIADVDLLVNIDYENIEPEELEVLESYVQMFFGIGEYDLE